MRECLISDISACKGLLHVGAVPRALALAPTLLAARPSWSLTSGNCFVVWQSKEPRGHVTTPAGSVTLATAELAVGVQHGHARGRWPAGSRGPRWLVTDVRRPCGGRPTAWRRFLGLALESDDGLARLLAEGSEVVELVLDDDDVERHEVDLVVLGEHLLYPHEHPSSSSRPGCRSRRSACLSACGTCSRPPWSARPARL